MGDENFVQSVLVAFEAEEGPLSGDVIKFIASFLALTLEINPNIIKMIS